MKTKFLAGLICTVFISVGFATPYIGISDPSFPSLPSLSSGDVSAWQECNAKIQGGADGFPWSVAKPFPWADIQGVWKLRDNGNPAFLKAKVIRTTSNRKILSLSVIGEGNCAKPLAQGIGYVDFSERNVVRAIMNDGVSKYQMKLASFDVRDLEIDSFTCGENVVVASIQSIGAYHNGRMGLRGIPEGGSEKVMLKKTSEDVGTICRKLDK